MAAPIEAPSTRKFSKRMFWTTPLVGVSKGMEVERRLVVGEELSGESREDTYHPPPRGR
jgi:hypothetical protein